LILYRGAYLADPSVTPGSTFRGVGAAQVCSGAWRREHNDNVLPVDPRNFYAVTQLYGLLVGPHTIYHLDHLIPLALGGDDTVANLWPQPGGLPVPRVKGAPAGGVQHSLPDPPGKPGFTTKNAVEARLHQLVCSGALPLATAQRAIAANWYAAYLKYG